MRRALSFAIKALISATLLYFAVDWTNLGSLGERLRHVDAGWLAAMMAVQAAQLLLGALRWRELIDLCGRAVSFGAVLRYAAIAAFFNQTLPSSVGGDAARIWLLAKGGAGWSAATYSVVIDRVIGVLTLSVIIIACLPWSLALIGDPIGRLGLAVIGFGSVSAIALFFALGVLRPRFLTSWAPTRHLTEAAATAARLWRDGRRTAIVLGISLTAHLFNALVAWCAAKAIHAPLTYPQSVFLFLPVLLVTVIPISIAGWGVRERAMTVAFAYAGMAQPDGLLISLLYGLSMFLIGAAGGLVWVVTPNKPAIGTLTTTPQSS